MALCAEAPSLTRSWYDGCIAPRSECFAPLSLFVELGDAQSPGVGTMRMFHVWLSDRYGWRDLSWQSINPGRRSVYSGIIGGKCAVHVSHQQLAAHAARCGHQAGAD